MTSLSTRSLAGRLALGATVVAAILAAAGLFVPRLYRDAEGLVRALVGIGPAGLAPARAPAEGAPGR